MCSRTSSSPLTVGHQAGQVAQVDDADDVVDALAQHRQPRAAGLDGEVERVAHGRGAGDVDHVDARHHHLAHDGVAELDDRADEVALLGLDRLVLVGDVGHGEDLVLGHRARLRPVGPKTADHAVRRWRAGTSRST